MTTTYTELREDARDYYRLCADEARALGIPISLDDPDSPQSVDAPRAAVAYCKEDDHDV